MSKNTSVESSTRSSPNPLINPTLQAALSCLDVQLEEELGRYRRQRAGRPVMSPRGLGRHQIRKPIELISVDKSGGQPQQPVSAQLPAASMPMLSIPLALGNPAPADASAKETPNQPIAKTGQMDTASAATAEPADVRVTPSSSNEAVSPAIAQDSMSEQLAPPEEPKQVEGDLVHSPAPQSPPEDYLESSEQLLRSLGEEEVESQPEKRFTDRLLTPLGVGLMLLVLLSSATVVYIATNPSALKALGLNQFLGSKTSTTAQSPTETTQAKVEPAKEAAALDGPNLAAEEFPEVNLDSLSQLETSPSPIPSSPSSSTVPAVPDLPNSQAAAPPLPVAPNQSVPGRSSDLGAALLPPALQPGAVAPAPTAPSGVPIPAPAAPPSAPSALRAGTPSPAQAKPQPLPAPATPATARKPEASPSPSQVAASDVPAQDDFYRVLLDYNGDRTLEQARTIVPDAYVINLSEGARIQMGAFKKESEAQSLIEQLQGQGISAYINRP